MKGRITSIQRFSLQDGPGIRTTVFLAGCNLRCKWCHNPETLTTKPMPLFYPEKCIGCGACVSACPTGAKGQQIDREKCITCNQCTKVCFAKAVVPSERQMTVEEVMQEVRQDATYYAYSGGGVTLSGGEALCQPDFCAAFLQQCRAENIGTAIETNLLHDFDAIRPILMQTDVIMADIKIMDKEAHRQWTGADNTPILANARRLGELGLPIIFRTPLIPGATATDENLLSVARFVAQIPNVSVYELLNYNPLGADKYAALGRENPFADARPFDKEMLLHWQNLLKEVKVPVNIR